MPIRFGQYEIQGEHLKVLLDKRPETRESRAGVTANLNPRSKSANRYGPPVQIRLRKKQKMFPSDARTPESYIAFRGLRDAAGFNWNAPLTAQVKRDSNVV